MAVWAELFGEVEDGEWVVRFLGDFFLRLGDGLFLFIRTVL